MTGTPTPPTAATSSMIRPSMTSGLNRLTRLARPIPSHSPASSTAARATLTRSPSRLDRAFRKVREVSSSASTGWPVPVQAGQFWTLALPLGNGLYLYFLYLPFAVRSVSLELNTSWYTLDLVGFTLIGQLLYTFFTMMLLSGSIFDREREQGTLEALLLSPANRLAVILGGALASAINYVWFVFWLLSRSINYIYI